MEEYVGVIQISIERMAQGEKLDTEFEKWDIAKFKKNEVDMEEY